MYFTVIDFRGVSAAFGVCSGRVRSMCRTSTLLFQFPRQAFQLGSDLGLFLEV